MKNLYFNPTPLYKEYLILELIYNNKDITQRDISNATNISLSMVNIYLDKYEDSNYLIRNKKTSKDVEYIITNKGIERMRVLNIGYLKQSQKMYKQAKEQIMLFLNRIINKGFKDIILYGAGEVAEIILQTINDDRTIPINVVCLIDDDLSKQGSLVVNTKVCSNDKLSTTKHDAVMISSYTNYQAIYDKLIEINYPKNKIEYFFKK